MLLNKSNDKSSIINQNETYPLAFDNYGQQQNNIFKYTQENPNPISIFKNDINPNVSDHKRTQSNSLIQKNKSSIINSNEIGNKAETKFPSFGNNIVDKIES